MIDKKAFFPLIGVSLFMVVTVISIFSYQAWLITYTNDINIDVDDKGLGGKLTSIRIPYIDADTIYLENTQDKDVKIVDIQLNGKSCGGAGTYPNGIVDVDLNCEYAITESNINTGGSGSGKKRKSSKLVIITEDELVVTEFFNQKIIPACSSNTDEGFQGGNGSSNSPWQICDCFMLQLMDNTSYNGNYFELTTDIDCSMSSSWNNGSGFDPIDLDNMIFNGKGNSINNLYINRPSSQAIGLFGMSSSSSTNLGKINNLALLNINFTGYQFIGSFAGGSYLSINNSYSTGVLTGWRAIGGLHGANTNVISYNTYSNVTNSYTTVDIYGTQEIGGIAAGGLASIIESSFVSSNINSSTSTGSIIQYITSLNSCNNTYWNNHSNNPSRHVYSGQGCYGEETAIQDDESYFYGNENEPMASWDTSIWSFNENRLPQLRKQN